MLVITLMLLLSPHAFYGGLWENFGRTPGYRPVYEPRYMRVYNQCPGFQSTCMNIAREIGNFVPKPVAENGGRLAAVLTYLVWAEDKEDGDGASIIKSNFSNIIYQEFHNINSSQFPIMARHLKSQCVYSNDQIDDDFVEISPVTSWQDDLIIIIKKHNLINVGNSTGMFSMFEPSLKEKQTSNQALIEALEGNGQALCANKKQILAIIRSGEPGKQIREYIKNGFVPDVTTVSELVEKLAAPRFGKQP